MIAAVNEGVRRRVMRESRQVVMTKRHERQFCNDFWGCEMKWFDRMTVFRKLLLAFAVVIGFCVVIGGVSLSKLSSMHAITDAICDRHMNGLYWMEEANRHKIDSDLAAANLGYATDDAGRDKLKESILGSLKSMHAAYDEYRKSIGTPKGRAMFEDVLGWTAPAIRAHYERHGLSIQGWDKVRTDWLTLHPTAAPADTLAEV